MDSNPLVAGKNENQTQYFIEQARQSLAIAQLALNAARKAKAVAKLKIAIGEHHLVTLQIDKHRDQ